MIWDTERGDKMNRYYTNGKEITEGQYKQIVKTNQQCFDMANETGDVSYMWQCQFVTVWDDGRPEPK